MTTTLSVIHVSVSQRAVSRLAGVAVRWRTRVVQALCALNGHERYRHLTRDRVCLRCLLCGHETKGWSLSPMTLPHDRGVPLAATRVKTIRFSPAVGRRDRLRTCDAVNGDTASPGAARRA